MQYSQNDGKIKSRRNEERVLRQSLYRAIEHPSTRRRNNGARKREADNFLFQAGE